MAWSRTGSASPGLLINPTEVHRQMTEKPIYLTRDGRDRLQAELDTLIRVTRLEVASRIAQAKDLGDLSENAEYEAAKRSEERR